VTAPDAAAAPPATVVTAPAGWHCIDFLSDLHLSAALPRTLEALREHLKHTPAQAVFVLGDLFELWVGDDARHGEFEARCVAMLRQASARTALHFVCGNRDFLLGPEMAQACGLSLLAEPVVVQAFGQRVLLAHGDALCLADTAYQAFRRQVRSTPWQHAFLAHPLADRQALAAAMRRESQASQARQAFDGVPWVDVDSGEALRWLEESQCQTLVHGHTHRPGVHTLDQGCTRWVLSDWDLDHASPPRGDVLRWQAGSLSRCSVA
jgi:UDP-2,3-diacylglucosamine hydrolase